MSNPFLESLREKRDALGTTVRDTMERAANDGRTELTESEEKNLREAQAEWDTLNGRVQELEEIERKQAEAARLTAEVDEAAGRTPSLVRVAKEEATYRPDMPEQSFFRDIAQRHTNDAAAMRLQRNNEEQAHLYRDTATGDIAGFSPPAYLVSDWAELRQAGRGAANIIPNQGAPNFLTTYIPKVSTTVVTAFQSSQNSSLGESDITAANVQVDMRTLGGYTDQSMQAVQFGWAHIGGDSFVFGELVKAFNYDIEDMVCNSSTSNNLGLINATGYNAVNYEDSSPTAAELGGKVGYAKAQVNNNAFTTANVIITDATVWNWLESRSDSAGRPLVTPYAPQNAPATFGAAVQGPVGAAWGLPVVLSQVLDPSNDATPGAHYLIVADISHSRLWESPPQFLMDPYSGSATGTVRFRIAGFVAQTHVRQPKAISIVTGSGLSLGLSNF